MSAIGTFRPSRSEPWKRSRRSALGSDSGPWKPRVPRAGSHPIEPFEAIGAKVGCGACVTNALSEYDGAELYER